MGRYDGRKSTQSTQQGHRNEQQGRYHDNKERVHSKRDLDGIILYYIVWGRRSIGNRKNRR